MKIGIMQPYFFPYLGYWQLINAVHTYVVYDDVSYIKGGWINRNNILINGKASLIALPLEYSSSFKNINEIMITRNHKKKEKLLKSISLAYAKAPYFDSIMPIIESLILKNEDIAILNYKAILEINNYIGINTKILLSSNIDKNNDKRGQDKIIQICKILNADHYINAIGGQQLYSNVEFKKNNINLNFLKMKNLEYKQFKNNFVPNLSIIDVLMFNSSEQIKELLDNYELL